MRTRGRNKITSGSATEPINLVFFDTEHDGVGQGEAQNDNKINNNDTTTLTPRKSLESSNATADKAKKSVEDANNENINNENGSVQNNTVPEPVESSTQTSSSSTAPTFNPKDYNVLSARYLQIRIRTDATLPSGMTLRRQTKSRAIDSYPKAFVAKIDALIKKNRHEEIYALLWELRMFELDVKRVPSFFKNSSCGGKGKGGKEGNGDELEAWEFVDLSENVESKCIDVDADDGSDEEYEWDEFRAFPLESVKSSHNDVVQKEEPPVAKEPDDSEHYATIKAESPTASEQEKRKGLGIARPKSMRKKASEGKISPDCVASNEIQNNPGASKQGKKNRSGKARPNSKRKNNYPQKQSSHGIETSSNRSHGTQINSLGDNASNEEKKNHSGQASSKSTKWKDCARNSPPDCIIGNIGSSENHSVTSGIQITREGRDEIRSFAMKLETNLSRRLQKVKKYATKTTVDAPQGLHNKCQHIPVALNAPFPSNPQNSVACSDRKLGSTRQRTRLANKKNEVIDLTDIQDKSATDESVTEGKYETTESIGSCGEVAESKHSEVYKGVSSMEATTVQHHIASCSNQSEEKVSTPGTALDEHISIGEEIVHSKQTQSSVGVISNDTDVARSTTDHNLPVEKKLHQSSRPPDVLDELNVNKGVDQEEKIHIMQPSNLKDRFKQWRGAIRKASIEINEEKTAVVTPHGEGKDFTSASLDTFPGNDAAMAYETGESRKDKLVRNKIEANSIYTPIKPTSFAATSKMKAGDIQKVQQKTTSRSDIRSYLRARDRKCIPQPPRDKGTETMMTMPSPVTITTTASTESESTQEHSTKNVAIKTEVSQNYAWQQKYNELKNYREKHGHCCVPHSFPENRSLGIWVSNQRYQMKLAQDGKKTAMNDKRISFLNDIGFVWKAQKGSLGKGIGATENKEEDRKPQSNTQGIIAGKVLQLVQEAKAQKRPDNKAKKMQKKGLPSNHKAAHDEDASKIAASRTTRDSSTSKNDFTSLSKSNICNHQTTKLSISHNRHPRFRQVTTMQGNHVGKHCLGFVQAAKALKSANHICPYRGVTSMRGLMPSNFGGNFPILLNRAYGWEGGNIKAENNNCNLVENAITNPRFMQMQIDPRVSFHITNLRTMNSAIYPIHAPANTEQANKEIKFCVRFDTSHIYPKHSSIKNAQDKFSIVPSCRTHILDNDSSTVENSKQSLADEWRKQSRKRRRGEWLPTGGWRPPQWAPPLQDERQLYLTNHQSKRRKGSPLSGCRKSLFPQLEMLMSKFSSLLTEEGIKIKVPDRDEGVDETKSLCGVTYPGGYIKPTPTVLKSAHLMVQSLLPKGDCECLDVVKIARSYYDHWRPAKGQTKVIILAESHAFTERERAVNGPGLDNKLLQGTYFGPREFVSLVYCLAYGENEGLASPCKDPNKGTPQFWALFAACSRGVKHVPNMESTSKNKNVKATFAMDVLKGGGLSIEERLKAKIEILQDLQRRGIWLLDASLFGWYITQPQEFNRSSKTNEIHRKAKTRPPKELKAPSLVLSWELFTKHVVREIANEGSLKLLIPIGMEVEASLTRRRMEDAISTDPKASVAETFPAPNAWIPGGYGPFHAKLAALVNEAAPRVDDCKTESSGFIAHAD